MTASTCSPPPLIGYLAFMELASHGIVGGYLLVNSHARPVEFHCNAPIRASRTEEILYGPTLRAYLYCDQVGKSLFQQSRCRPQLVLTDEPIAMELRHATGVPVVFVRTDDVFTSEAQPDDDRSRLDVFHLRGWPMATHAEFGDDREAVPRLLEELTSRWDLVEPLSRIRDAISEAQRAAA